ncbi:hypothetical protein ACPCHT_14340 [Nucisporomicrobium flavum]|uniref:hypothetical protein n=1 Tax=Nucisporomicrobium flavum TaxID=2785915 RepID=UPI003C2EEC07
MVFDQRRYEEDVIKPMRSQKGPLTDDDLLRRYAIEPGLTDAAELKQHLRKLRTYWNQTASLPTGLGQVCKRLMAADEDLKKRPDARLEDPAWWAGVRTAKANRARQAVGDLANELKDAFGSLGSVTRTQVNGVAKQYPQLDPADIDAAVRQAGLRVLDVVDLPESSGLDRAAYRALAQRLHEVGAPTIVQVLHPDLNRPYALVQAFAVNGRPELRLDEATLKTRIKEADTAADSPMLRARRAALRLLQTGVGAGADLRVVALYQVVEALLESRGDNLVDAFLIRVATRLGLTQEDAELIVASLPSGRTGGSSGAVAIRDMLASGQLRAAQGALGGLAATDPERAGIVAEIAQLEAKLATLLNDAEQALRDRREDEAERLILAARRIAEDDEAVQMRYARLPMPPVRDLRVVVAGTVVQLDWQPPASAMSDIRYRVVRRLDADPGGPQDGTKAGETGDTSLTDSRPPVGRDLHYAVFASGNGGAVWSRSATGTARLVPEVADATVRPGTDRITLTWQAHPDVAEVRVRRTEGRPPRGTGDGVGIPAGRDTLVDRQLREGVEYFYGLVAVYHDDQRREVLSRMTVVSGSPQAEARPLGTLQVEPVRRRGNSVQVRLTWPADAGTVRVRYAPGPPAWDFGAVITPAEAARYGRELPGLPEVYGHECVLEADVPAGPQLYVPFTTGPSGLVVGRPVHGGHAEPVRALQTRRTGERVTVTWVWPEEAGVAEVRWERPDAPTETRRVTRAAYVDGDGCVLVVGAAGGTVSVRAITAGPAGDARSDAVTQAVSGRAIEVRYSIRRPSGFKERYSRQRDLEIVTDQDCADLDLAVVVAPGPVMPLAVQPEVVAERFAGLAPRRGVPMPLSFTVPKTAKPYWIRVFATRPDNVTVIDPPIAELKVS